MSIYFVADIDAVTHPAYKNAPAAVHSFPPNL